ncbi:hypothetical protein LCGC14_1501330 [marine sediment metagenome]|uniref:Uncharacterized protein n=1 Tax=marine sediment metagenome TaxID=412755 RepID=A0A0F9M5F6_9ZZZZ
MTDEATQAAAEIAANAQKPKRATVDGTTIEQHSIKDQIEAEKFRASQAATRNGGMGLRRVRIKTPGAS